MQMRAALARKQGQRRHTDAPQPNVSHPVRTCSPYSFAPWPACPFPFPFPSPFRFGGGGGGFLLPDFVPAC